MCPEFLKMWGHKLDYKKHGFITNSKQQKTLIQFIKENGYYYIICGISLAIMNGITMPTQVELYFNHNGNNFSMLCLRQEPTPSTLINISSEGSNDVTSDLTINNFI
jgi:hypothetical protein